MRDIQKSNKLDLKGMEWERKKQKSRDLTVKIG